MQRFQWMKGRCPARVAAPVSGAPLEPRVALHHTADTSVATSPSGTRSDASFRSLPVIIAALLLSPALPSAAVASTYAWANARLGTWSDPAGWIGGIVPSGDPDNVITFTTTANTKATNDLGPFVLNRMVAINGSPSNKALNIEGTSAHPLVFVRSRDGATPIMEIANNAESGPLKIGVPIRVTDTLTITNSGTKPVTIPENIVNTSGILFIGPGPGPLTLGRHTGASLVSGAGGITLNCAYVLKLTGANTYTGDTTIVSGTLELAGPNRIADTSRLVMAGGAFDTGGHGETLGPLRLSADSVIDLQNGASTLSFAASGAEPWNTAARLSFENFNPALGSIRFGSDRGGLAPAQLARITINGRASAIDADGFLVIAPTP